MPNSHTPSIYYDHAVIKINEAIDAGWVRNTFHASSILAWLFNLNKERTITDLLELRQLNYEDAP